MKRIISLISALCLLQAAVSAQELIVTSAPDTTAILLGDQTGFTVSAVIPAGTVARLSEAGDTLAGKIVVLRRSPRDSATGPDGKIIISDRYLITAFDSGTYTIPPFYAEIASGDTLLRYYSENSFLTVLRPDVTPPDSTDVIFDIVPPRRAPVTFAEIVPWLVITVVAAGLLWLLARFLPRNPLRRFVRPLPPPEPAHVIALRELTVLRTEELWQKGEVKEYYSRLSDILRRYIDNRYSISSPELTTDETVLMLQKAAVTTGTQMSVVKEMLSLSDMVKFAKYVPESSLHERCYEDALKFVEETKVTEETAGERAEEGGRHA